MKPGEIYHLEEVEPLHGGKPKGRYVIVITNPQDMSLDSPIYVVACSSTIQPAQIDAGEAVELPWHRQGAAQTGFRRRTWAVPKWMLKVRPSQLGRCIGRIPATKLQEIIAHLSGKPKS